MSLMPHSPVIQGTARPEELVESYRRLGEVFHDVLSEQSLDLLLDRIADTLAELVPYDSLTLFQADVERSEPVLANNAHLDPRVTVVPGTPANEPESLISVPLIARGTVKGALKIY